MRRDQRVAYDQWKRRQDAVIETGLRNTEESIEGRTGKE